MHSTIRTSFRSDSPSSPWFRSSSVACFALGLLCQACPGTPVCGDAYVDIDEMCDDGNIQSGDGCSLECELEAGYECVTDGDACQAEYAEVCGDGILTASEQCDDGARNSEGYGNCTPSCTLGPFCGDGVVDSAVEECDEAENTASTTWTPSCTRR
jgi:cysteine-rich repeat protein